MLSTCKTRSGNKLSKVQPSYSAIQSLHHSTKINEGCMNSFQLRLWTITQTFALMTSTVGPTINAEKNIHVSPLSLLTPTCTHTNFPFPRRIQHIAFKGFDGGCSDLFFSSPLINIMSSMFMEGALVDTSLNPLLLFYTVLGI